MAHQYQFLVYSAEHTGRYLQAGVALAPCRHGVHFRLAAAEHQYSCVGMAVGDDGQRLFHLLLRVYLAFMGGKRCHSYPLLFLRLHVERFGELREFVAAVGKDGFKLHFHRIAQLGEYVGIVAEWCGLLHELLVLHRRDGTSSGSMLVDMCHFETVDIEPHAQIFRPQHAVQVGDGGEVLCHQPAVKGVQPLHSMVLVLEVSFHKPHVVWHVLEERAREFLAKHRNPDVRILLGQ